MKLQLAAGFATAILLAAPAYAQNFGASGFSAKERAAFTTPAHARTTTKTKVVHTHKTHRIGTSTRR